MNNPQEHKHNRRPSSAPPHAVHLPRRAEMRHRHLRVRDERVHLALGILVQREHPLLVAHHPHARVDAEHPRLALGEQPRRDGDPEREVPPARGRLHPGPRRARERVRHRRVPQDARAAPARALGARRRVRAHPRPVERDVVGVDGGGRRAGPGRARGVGGRRALALRADVARGVLLGGVVHGHARGQRHVGAAEVDEGDVGEGERESGPCVRVFGHEAEQGWDGDVGAVISIRYVLVRDNNE
jgi:hypothetical protein